MLLKRILNNILEILFPKFCFSCQKEGDYLCQDCLSTIDILESSFCLCQTPKRLTSVGKCQLCKNKNLDGLYFPTSYKNNLIKNLIHKFKYEPYIKDLSKILSLLIITHFNLIQRKFSPENYLLVHVPLTIKKLKKRGFN
jgi:predicted amidophosphoribosyltransferase